MTTVPAVCRIRGITHRGQIAKHGVQADEDSQQDGLGSKGKGKSRKGQNRWLSRWLVRDGSSKKQGKEKAGSRKHEATAPQHLETKSLEPRKAPVSVQGPGELAPPVMETLSSLRAAGHGHG